MAARSSTDPLDPADVQTEVLQGRLEIRAVEWFFDELEVRIAVERATDVAM